MTALPAASRFGTGRAFGFLKGRGLLPVALTTATGVAAWKVAEHGHGPHPLSDSRWALGWASLATAAVLVILWLFRTGDNQRGFMAYLIGDDNRLSTSKTQVGLWTVAVVFTFLFFTLQLMHAADTGELTRSFSRFGPEYLLLLGGPFAAAVVANASTTDKTQAQTLQKVPAAGGPKISDVVNDDAGHPALADAQFFLFNLVALTYFATALARHPQTLPQLPSTLVGLTSISALTYLGAKITTTNPAAITSVFRHTSTGPAHQGIRPQDVVQIVGTGFLPAGATTVQAVLFGTTPGALDPATPPTDSSLLVTVPAGVTGDVPVAVLTQANVQTPPLSVSIS